jgi:tyrosyl-DNA phosphodiesterase 2
VQLGLIARALRDKHLTGGVVCGDMNVIRREDESLAEDADLLDAWSGKRGDVSGHTWGYQPRCVFIPCLSTRNAALADKTVMQGSVPARAVR